MFFGESALAQMFFLQETRVFWRAYTKVRKFFERRANTVAFRDPSLIVVKFGTSVLMGGQEIISEHFRDIARQVHELTKNPNENFVILVSSGAIRTGWERLYRHRTEWEIDRLLPDSLDKCSIEEKKLLAAIGQPMLMGMWSAAFGWYLREVAQVLVTHANWENEGERESIRLMLETCRRNHVVPIVNENDPVSDIEIHLMEGGISENDILAAKTASLMDAGGILFVTESGGVRFADPSEDPDASVIPLLSVGQLDGMSTKEAGKSGRGGMGKKFEAVHVCAEHDPAMNIVIAGLEENVILRFAKGAPVGTKITTGVEHPWFHLNW